MSAREKFEANLRPQDIEYLDHAFNYHAPPNEDIVKMHEQARESCRRLAAMALHLPPCREASLALTNIEQAMMWINAAIARNHEAILKNLAEQRGDG